jgi:superfamily I DNA/RNA helicase
LTQRIIKYIGPPGCSKTTTLIRHMMEHLEAGVSPERIAFVTFTKKAAREAMDRAVAATGFSAKRFPFFKTLHALSFAQLGLRRENVLGPKHMTELSSLLGVEVHADSNFSDDYVRPVTGSPVVVLEQLSRVLCRELRDVWEERGEDADWHELLLYQKGLAEYKRQNGLVDFSDMLTEATKLPPIDIAVAMVDEANDLSVAQYRYAAQVLSKAEQLIVAGDPQQCIYGWGGADAKLFIDMQADETRGLNQSYRTPRAIHSLLQKIIEPVKDKLITDWQPAPWEGSVEYVGGLDELPWDEMLTGNTSFMLLARTHWLLRGFITELRERGILYSTQKLKTSATDSALRAVVEGTSEADSDELEYYQLVLETPQSPEPNVIVSTLHGQKGAEADTVCLLLDVTCKVYDAMQDDPDPEHRLFYVGASRARQRLILVEPMTQLYYEMPQ